MENGLYFEEADRQEPYVDVIGIDAERKKFPTRQMSNMPNLRSVVFTVDESTIPSTRPPIGLARRHRRPAAAWFGDNANGSSK